MHFVKINCTAKGKARLRLHLPCKDSRVILVLNSCASVDAQNQLVNVRFVRSLHCTVCIEELLGKASAFHLVNIPAEKNCMSDIGTIYSYMDTQKYMAEASKHSKKAQKQ